MITTRTITFKTVDEHGEPGEVAFDLPVETIAQTDGKVTKEHPMLTVIVTTRNDDGAVVGQHPETVDLADVVSIELGEPS